jgi:hypothetical protein
VGGSILYRLFTSCLDTAAVLLKPGDMGTWVLLQHLFGSPYVCLQQRENITNDRAGQSVCHWLYKQVALLLATFHSGLISTAYCKCIWWQSIMSLRLYASMR